MCGDGAADCAPDVASHRLKHHLNRYPVPDWAHQQVYLHPYPKELMLRNHVQRRSWRIPSACASQVTKLKAIHKLQISCSVAGQPFQVALKGRLQFVGRRLIRCKIRHGKGPARRIADPGA
jgi:hypothetical protein